MSETVMALTRRVLGWRLLVPMIATAALGVGALVWGFGLWPAPRFIEYPMLVETDIPTAIAVGPDSIWFTIEFSDAIGVFRNRKIDRLPKSSQNLEPLGLAADGAGGAWYTDTPARAISRISSDGSIQSFRLSTPIVRLGRLAVAPDGAVWFADVTTASVMQLKNGVFIRHELGTLGATPYGIAIDPSGTVWTTLQGADQLGWISADGRLTAVDVPTRNSVLSDITVDRYGAVWFLELRANKIGRLAEGRFSEFDVPTPSAGLTGLAAAPDGSVWFTELGVGRLGRLWGDHVTEFPLPRPKSRPFGVAVDAANNVWYTDLAGWLGMLPASAAKAP